MKLCHDCNLLMYFLSNCSIVKLSKMIDMSRRMSLDVPHKSSAHSPISSIPQEAVSRKYLKKRRKIVLWYFLMSEMSKRIILGTLKLHLEICFNSTTSYVFSDF